MAKSFHTILDEGVFIVSHLGEEVELTLPEWLIKAAPLLNDEKQLLKWAVEHKVLHGLLHNGIQKLIIDLRAIARPTIKTINDPTEFFAKAKSLSGNTNWIVKKSNQTISKSILSDCDKAQNRVNSFKLKAVPEPGQSKTTSSTNKKACQLSMEPMINAGLSKEDIYKYLIPAFGKAVVSDIYVELTT